MSHDEADAPAHITARHFAVLLILAQVRKVRREINDNDIERDLTDFFRSEIDVYLHRTVEELLRAVKYLHDNDAADGT